MGISIQAWLSVQGFTTNPFEIWQADKEELLERYFVRPDVFDAVRGQSTAQESVVLFAPRGHGKSALRRLIAADCAHDLHHPALVVELTNYDWAEGGAPTSRALYREVLTRLASGQIWAQLARHPERMAALHASPLLLLRLHALSHWSARRSSERPPRLALPDEETRQLAEALRMPRSCDAEELVRHLVEEYRGEELVRTMGDLVAICQAAGYSSLLYLVDRVDEDEHTEGDWDAALRLIQPLFNLHLLEIDGLAFKFFLPDALETTMRARGVAMRLGNRPRRCELTWSTDQLAAMMRMRLAAFSRDADGYTRIRSFADLCEGVSQADTRLAAASAGSPRRLIRLARAVVAAHCALAGEAEELITSACFASAVAAGVAGMAAEAAELSVPPRAETVSLTPMAQPRVEPSAADAPQAQPALRELPERPPLLRLEADGTVWLGAERHRGKISRVCRLILEALWRHRSRYLRREELYAALKVDEQYEESLYKAVVRLREQLEPNLKNSKHYIEDVTGVGYRLTNFVDEASP